MPASPTKLAGEVAAVAALAGAFVVPALPAEYIALDWAWLTCAALLVVFCAAIGLAISERPAGLIIDNRNRVSLSKLQAAAWSIVVLSALISAAFARLHSTVTFPSPIDIDIPQALLAVMGISATSLVASPVILSLKSGETPVDGQEATTASKLGDDVGSLASVGKVYARSNAEDAQWLDLFRGEEVSNAASPDLSKVQQFLITVIVLAIYGGSIWSLFGAAAKDTTWLGSLPNFSEHMAWLIGISHAGYLAYTAAPHGASGDPAAAPTPAPAPPPADGAVG